MVYVSRARESVGPDDLEAIAAASERGNRACGLTGLLLHGGGRFYGVLEGPRRQVLARMERIIIDPRHHSLRIMREDDVRAQRFANWSFADIGQHGGRDAPVDALENFILRVATRH